MALIAQVLGLKAVWPWKTSAETSARGVREDLVAAPEELPRYPGSAVLTPLETGRRRASEGASSVPVQDEEDRVADDRACPP